MDLPACYTPLWVSPPDKPVDDRLVNSCLVSRYQYIYYIPLWAHVDVLAVYILMFENHVRLRAISQPLHILLPDLGKLFIGQLIVRVRVQRNMDNRFLGGDMRRHKPLKILHTGRGIERSIGRFDY
nr:MAG TPA_asm: hypothetical protein [Bacteriophage sp.]